MDKKEEFKIIAAIAKRAEEMDLLMFDRLSLIMDLQHATEEFNLRFEEFLNADDYNFAHDIWGIQKNFNRETQKMDNCFIPRFAGRYS